MLKTNYLSNSDSGVFIGCFGNPGKNFEIRRDLAPSEELSRKYLNNKISFSKFKREYVKELYVKRSILEKLTKQAEKEDITLVCFEKNPEHCHRSILARVLKNINPKIQICIK